VADYIGDFPPGKFLRRSFNTHTAAGAPITLAGTPSVVVYSTSVAATGTGTGVNEDTLGVDMITDYDSRTGRHVVLVDTAIDPVFFCAGNDYEVVLAAGTVDGVSIAGTTLFTFSIHNRSFGDTAAFSRAVGAIVTGVVAGGATTTSIPTMLLDPAASATDQFKGRILCFDRLTATAALRGQATDLTASTSGGVLTCTALSTAPAAGDTFTIQ
jgi:hypothetical protein